MQWNRVKHILLLVLLAVDLFLAVNFGWKYFVDYARTQQNLTNIVSLLGEQDITVSDAFSLPEAEHLPALDIDRATYQEELFSQGLLGINATRTEFSSGIVEYVSPVGAVRWQPNGAVQATLQPMDYTMPQSASAARTNARAMLQSAGIVADFIWEDATATQTKVSFTTAGMSVFNRSLTVYFGANHVTISGWWTFDTPYTTHSDNQVEMMPIDAIFAFVNAQEISRLDQMEAGYLLTQSATARLQLVPVWRMETDAGLFYMDALKYTILDYNGES